MIGGMGDGEDGWQVVGGGGMFVFHSSTTSARDKAWREKGIEKERLGNQVQKRLEALS